MIKYCKGDLFSAAGPNTILVHACNCMGSWGAGIAAQFKIKYPNHYKEYKRLCNTHKEALLGLGIYYYPKTTSQNIGFLFTSISYGKNKSPEQVILQSTEQAISGLLRNLDNNIEIHSPKINAGLFEVPWSKTEEIICKKIKETGHSWTVWEL